MTLNRRLAAFVLAFLAFSPAPVLADGNNTLYSNAHGSMHMGYGNFNGNPGGAMQQNFSHGSSHQEQFQSNDSGWVPDHQASHASFSRHRQQAVSRNNNYTPSHNNSYAGNNHNNNNSRSASQSFGNSYNSFARNNFNSTNPRGSNFGSNRFLNNPINNTLNVSPAIQNARFNFQYGGYTIQNLINDQRELAASTRLSGYNFFGDPANYNGPGYQNFRGYDNFAE